MLTFYLVRHGTKEAIPFDPPLTEVGVKQAKITAEILKDVGFKEIIASPKLRTKQTAQIIAEKVNLPVTFDKRLIERLEWEYGETFEEFMKEWDKTSASRSYKPRKGMSSVANGARMRNVVEEFSKKYNNGNILIVTHGGTIGDLLRNLFSERLITQKKDPITGVIHIEVLECSITTILKDKDLYKLVKLADISHLSTPLI